VTLKDHNAPACAIIAVSKARCSEANEGSLSAISVKTTVVMIY